MSDFQKNDGQEAGSTQSEEHLLRVFEEYRQTLHRSVSGIIKRQEHVEDVLQETYRLVLEATRKNEVEHPKSYLYITARRLAIRANTKVSEKITDYMEDVGVSHLSSSEPNAFQVLASEERSRMLSEIIDTLPEQCRRAFVLRLRHGMSYKQIAETLGISVSTTEKHLAKAMRRCSEAVRTMNDD